MAQLTHYMGVGGVTDEHAVCGGITDAPGLLQFNLSRNPDMSDAILSAGIQTTAGEDNAGQETISGLTPNTTYYVWPQVDGVLAPWSAPAKFATSPALGYDAAFRWWFGSCMKTPNSPVFPFINGDAPSFGVHLGDYFYGNTTDPALLAACYRSVYGGDYLTDIVRAMAMAFCGDDHDGGGNNIDGSLANKANILAAFKRYRPIYPLANPANGGWYSFWWANVQFFMLDTRYQREHSKPRWPSKAVGWDIAQPGTDSTHLVVPTTASISGWVADAHIEIENVGVYRAASWTYPTRTIMPREPIPGMVPGVRYAVKAASLLDMNGIPEGQTDWLINGLNASSARWNVIGSSVMFNKTATSLSDVWAGFDATDRYEQRYIMQRLSAAVKAKTLVISGDRHSSAIDDGSHSDFPECMSSPLDNTNTDWGNSLWSNGAKNIRKYYALGDVGSDHSLTLTVKDHFGQVAQGITPLLLGPE